MNKETIVNEIYTTIGCYGLAETFYKLFGKRVKIKIGYSKRCCDAPIEELSLSVRSYNALKRGGFDYIDKVIDAISDGELMKLRNLGIKSFVEIQVKLMEYGYTQLSEKEQKNFILDILTLNNAV